MSRKKRQKTTFFKQFVLYLILALLTGFCLFSYPFHEALHPVEITEYEQLSRMRESDYVNLKPSMLYYTGCDYVEHKKIKGHYYYALSDQQCFYVLLKADRKNEPKEKLTSVNVNCKLLKREDVLTHLNASLAKQIGWSGEKLEKIVYPFIACEPDYRRGSIYLFMMILSLQLFLLCAFAVYSLYRFLCVKH